MVLGIHLIYITLNHIKSLFYRFKKMYYSFARHYHKEKLSKGYIGFCYVFILTAVCELLMFLIKILIKNGKIIISDYTT